MTRLGMGIKGSVAITIITLLLVGCGNTGPDQQNVNNEGVGSNTSVNYGSQSSFDSTSNTGSSAGNLGVVEPNISIKLKSKEVQEGSFTTQLTENGEPLIWPAVNSWPDGETVLTSDDSITIPLEFTLAHPLSGKYQVTVEYDVDRSDCAEVLYVDQKGLVDIPQGATEFLINAKLSPDIDPEDDCDARFKVSFSSASSKQAIEAEGSIRIKDDDRNVHDVVLTEVKSPGDYISWPLNGSRRYDGSSFVVNQVQGPAVDFSVKEDQLKLIVPAVEAGTITSRTVVLSVQPETSKPYTISFLVDSGIGEPLVTEDTTAGDSDIDTTNVVFFKSAKALGYYSGFIAPKNLTELKWTIVTESLENYVVVDHSSLEFYRDGPSISDEDWDQLSNLLILNSDNRTLVIDPEKLAILQKYLDDGLFPRIEWDIKIYPSSSVKDDWIEETQQYTYQRMHFSSWLKPAPRKATISLLGLDDNQISKSNLRMIIRQQSDVSYRVMRYKSVRGISTEFDFLPQGAYEVLVVDLEKGEVANGIFTLDDSVFETHYQLELRDTPSALESNLTKVVLSKKNNPKEVGGQANNVSYQATKPSETCKDDRGDAYYVGSANQDLEISCSKTFSTDELKGDVVDVKRQLVIQVESLEYPAFLPRSASDGALKKFKDTWSWAVDTKIDALKSMTKSAAGEIQSSHKTARSVFTVSPCFTLPKDSTDTIKFTAKAKNVGDNQGVWGQVFDL